MDKYSAEFGKAGPLVRQKVPTGQNREIRNNGPPVATSEKGHEVINSHPRDAASVVIFKRKGDNLGKNKFYTRSVIALG